MVGTMLPMLAGMKRPDKAMLILLTFMALMLQISELILPPGR